MPDMLLRCVTSEMGKKILEELYKGVSSSHIGGGALVVTTIQLAIIGLPYAKML